MSTAPPLRDYLVSNAVVAVLIRVVVSLFVAGLAVSRTDGHALSPGLLAGIVIGTTLGVGVIGWPTGLYGGAYDRLAGRVATGPAAGGDNPFAASRLWWLASAWAVGIALWVAAGAGLIAVALDGEHARVGVVIAALVGLGAVVAVAVDVLARRRGALAARPLGTATPLRRRAWLHVAAPVAASQALVNGGLGWVLFHDYVTGDAFAEEALTEKVALADVTLIVLLLTTLFAFIAGRWGAVDAALGVVEPDDPAAQNVPAKAPLGRQGIVYVAAAAFVVGRLVTWMLPPTPSLTAVVVARGLFSGLIVFAIVGIAYVRGALNTRAGVTPLGARA